MYHCFVVRPVKILAEQVKSEYFFLQGFFFIQNIKIFFLLDFGVKCGNLDMLS